MSLAQVTTTFPSAEILNFRSADKLLNSANLYVEPRRTVRQSIAYNDNAIISNYSDLQRHSRSLASQVLDKSRNLWVVLMNRASQTSDSVRQRHPFLKLVNYVSAVSVSVTQFKSSGMQLRVAFR